MSELKPNSHHLREAVAHWIISDTRGKTDISDGTCGEWFQRFKSGDFAVVDRHSGGREKVSENAELEAILSEDSCQTQEELSESLATGKANAKEISPSIVLLLRAKNGYMAITPREAENNGDYSVVILLRQHLSRISMAQKSCTLRLMGGQLGVIYYELLKPSQVSVALWNAIDAVPEPPPQVAKLAVKRYLETSKWEILPHPPPYSPDVAPSADFHLTHLAQWHTAWLTSTSGLKKK
nr:Mariner Mos1 transposase [Hymenolepis microstoma]